MEMTNLPTWIKYLNISIWNILRVDLLIPRPKEIAYRKETSL